MSRELFPTLPAELRNHIYAYASLPFYAHQPAHTTGLPFATKTYEICHTKITISPVHYGNLGLLALRKYNFLEGYEYHNWLQTHGLELRIAVLFNGHVNTFVQKHWDEKLQRSLKKLVRKYEWLAKSAKWDVMVLWEPGVDSVRRAKASAIGGISKAMASTILGFRGESVRARKGDVKVRVHLPLAVAAERIGAGVGFGLDGFLVGDVSINARNEVWEITMGAPEVKKKQMSRLLTVRDVLKKREMLVIDGGRVWWDKGTHGALVMRRVVENGKEWWEMLEFPDKDQRHSFEEVVLVSLRDDCGAAGEVRVAER